LISEYHHFATSNELMYVNTDLLTSNKKEREATKHYVLLIEELLTLPTKYSCPKKT
jgi:hypothetical protein